MNFADHSSAQKSGKDVGIDLIVLDLGLGDDACLEGVGQDDVFMRKMRLKEFVEPSPVYGGLENHTAAGMSLDQVNEELWCAVVDAPFFKDAVGGINRAKNTVSLMEVDSDRDWVVVG